MSSPAPPASSRDLRGLLLLCEALEREGGDIQRIAEEITMRALRAA